MSKERSAAQRGIEVALTTCLLFFAASSSAQPRNARQRPASAPIEKGHAQRRAERAVNPRLQAAREAIRETLAEAHSLSSRADQAIEERAHTREGALERSRAYRNSARLHEQALEIMNRVGVSLSDQGPSSEEEIRRSAQHFYRFAGLGYMMTGHFEDAVSALRGLTRLRATSWEGDDIVHFEVEQLNRAVQRFERSLRRPHSLERRRTLARDAVQAALESEYADVIRLSPVLDIVDQLVEARRVAEADALLREFSKITSASPDGLDPMAAEQLIERSEALARRIEQERPAAE